MKLLQGHLNSYLGGFIFCLAGLTGKGCVKSRLVAIAGMVNTCLGIGLF